MLDFKRDATKSPCDSGPWPHSQASFRFFPFLLQDPRLSGAPPSAGSRFCRSSGPFSVTPRHEIHLPSLRRLFFGYLCGFIWYLGSPEQVFPAVDALQHIDQGAGFGLFDVHQHRTEHAHRVQMIGENQDASAPTEQINSPAQQAAQGVVGRRGIAWFGAERSMYSTQRWIAGRNMRFGLLWPLIKLY